MPDQPTSTNPTASATPPSGAKPATPPEPAKSQPGPAATPKTPPAAGKTQPDPVSSSSPTPGPTPSAPEPAKPESPVTPPPTAEPPVAPEPSKEPAAADATTPEPSPSPDISSGPTLEEKPGEEVPPEKRNAKLFTIGLILTLAVLGSVGGIFYFKNNQAVEEEVVLGETEEAVEEEMVATPTPGALTREEISLEILNGSGVAGAAGDAAEEFEELGYQIAEIGNADTTEGNELYVNPEVEGLVEQLLEDVEGMLEITSVSGELTDSDASARIILGE